MEKRIPKGVCLFAYNTPQFDYIKLAIVASTYVKKHLNLPVCLITDEHGEKYYDSEIDSKVKEGSIDYIVTTDDNMKQNIRGHFDSPWTEFRSQFNNSNKHKIWTYSPFEETILIDTDYIIKTNFLSHCFGGTYNGVAMFDRAMSLRNDLPHPAEQWLHEAGIKMWWSTVVYFDRSDESKMFFDLWAHVADNYDFYQYLYNFPGKLFRTDYCVSIATHILNGMTTGDTVSNFANRPMINMSQKDDIIELKDNNDWIFLCHEVAEPWKNILVRHSLTDVHVMNKRALERHAHQVIENIFGPESIPKSWKWWENIGATNE